MLCASVPLFFPETGGGIGGTGGNGKTTVGRQCDQCAASLQRMPGDAGHGQIVNAAPEGQSDAAVGQGKIVVVIVSAENAPGASQGGSRLE